MEKCASFINILTGNGGSYYVVTYIRLFLFNVLWIISKINLSYHLFLLWSNSGHPVKQLYNVIEILFYFKLDTPLRLNTRCTRKSMFNFYCLLIKIPKLLERFGLRPKMILLQTEWYKNGFPVWRREFEHTDSPCSGRLARQNRITFISQENFSTWKRCSSGQLIEHSIFCTYSNQVLIAIFPVYPRNFHFSPVHIRHII